MIEHTKNLQISLIDVIKLRLKQIIENESNVETTVIKLIKRKQITESENNVEATKIFIKEAKAVYDFINKYIEHIHFNRRGTTKGSSSNKLKEDIQVVCSYKSDINIPYNIRPLLEKYLLSKCMHTIYEELLPVNNIGINKKEINLPKVSKFKRSKDQIDNVERHTKIAIHTVSQFYGDNKQLSLFSDEKIDTFKNDTGLNLTNRPTNYGVVLNQAQRKVFEGILKAFTNTNYKGDEQKDKATALGEVYSDTETSAKTLVIKDNAPYKNIDSIPVVKLTQSQIIELSGYDLKSQRQGDKQDVIEALSFLATNQFCFYWIRLKTDKGKPVKEKSGDYIKEEVMEVGTLLRIKTVRDQTGLLQYYEIQPSAPLLDQINNYFLLVPNNWRDEVKQLTGKRASSYTYELLLWLRLQYEQIRRYNKGGDKNRKAKTFKITKSWEDVAIALKMPETMYKANRKRASKIIQEAYSVAIKLNYLVGVENNGATDILYLNEGYYPKPGELV
jgi:hypothetical protein